MKYSFKLKNEDDRNGLWSDNYIEKYMNKYDPYKKDKKGNYIEDYELFTIDKYAKTPFPQKLRISLVCWGKNPHLVLEGRNLITKYCDGTGKKLQVFPKGSHTSYGGKLMECLVQMPKNIVIWMWEIKEIKCLGCKKCKSNNVIKKTLKKLF